mgnify:CR=1 FL=1
MKNTIRVLLAILIMSLTSYSLAHSGRTDAYGNDISRDGRTGQTQKSIEQPKVASQMDNSGVKSNLITADKTAPTDIEMTQDERTVANKRGKKTPLDYSDWEF